MIELRYRLGDEPLGFPNNPTIVKKVKVLQYRNSIDEEGNFWSEEYCKNLDVDRDFWTEWRDVPLVDELNER